MAAKQGRKATSIEPNVGRKSAYFARNRASLIKSAQEVLADIGPGATIEQIAEMAEVSVSTIYKHFENKDALFGTAIVEAMREWEKWAEKELSEIHDPLEELVFPMRMILRLGTTHPKQAKMIANNISDLPKYVPGISSGLRRHIETLIEKKILTLDNSAIRIQSLLACLQQAMVQQLTVPKPKQSDADIAVEIAITILGIPSKQAHELAHSKLPAHR